MTDNRYFIKTPYEACKIGETGSPLYGDCANCPNRAECKKMSRETIKSQNSTQEWCKKCIAENNSYAKYITFNKKKQCYECDWEMVELEAKAEIEPENLTASEKMRLKNYQNKSNFTIKKFFERIADFFEGGNYNGNT